MDIRAVLVGCITGFLSAFFGIGGSSIDTPVLRTFLGLPALKALGTPLPLSVLTATIAAVVYRKGRLINVRVAALSLASALPGMVLGSFLSSYFSGRSLMLLTAVILFLVGFEFISKTRLGHKVKGPAPASRVLSVAAFIGVLSGVLANGGGIFFVPAYVMLLGMEMKEAVATSLVVVAVVSVPGSVIHYMLGHVDPATTASMALGVMPMAYLGAKFDIRTRAKTLMLLYGVFLMVFAAYFFISQI